MTWRLPAAVGVLCSCLALWAFGAPLVALDVQVTTWLSTPMTFVVRVTDAGIDLLAPEAHAILFSIEAGPAHGVVAGDLSAVLYEAPADALLVLSYVPVPGYVGEDSLRLRARDPLGAFTDIPVSIAVTATSAEGTLSGHSLLTATVDVSAVALRAMSWAVDAKYSFHATTFEAGLLVKLEGADEAFDDLYFGLTTPFGAIGTATLRLDFNPDPLSDLFDFADLSCAFSLGGASIQGSFRTDGTPAGARASFAFSGSTPDGGLALNARITLASCDPTIDSAVVTIKAPGLACGTGGCEIDLSATVGFSCEGFRTATLLAEGIELPDVGLLSLATSAAALITYEVESKSLEISPRFATLAVDCFAFGTEIVWADSALVSARLTSFRVDHTFAHGVRLRMETSLFPGDLALNKTVTGYVDYWEADFLSGEFAVCQGIRGDWEVGVYFARPGVAVQLFDWGMLALRTGVTCDESWELFTELTFRSGVFGDPTCEWLLGADVVW